MDILGVHLVVQIKDTVFVHSGKSLSLAEP